MVEGKVVVKNETGIHARPALAVVKEATKWKSDIFIIKDDTEYNAKSIVGIMTMIAVKGDELTIRAIGEDEEKAAEAMVNLIDNGLN